MDLNVYKGDLKGFKGIPVILRDLDVYKGDLKKFKFFRVILGDIKGFSGFQGILRNFEE